MSSAAPDSGHGAFRIIDLPCVAFLIGVFASSVNIIAAFLVGIATDWAWVGKWLELSASVGIVCASGLLLAGMLGEVCKGLADWWRRFVPRARAAWGWISLRRVASFEEQLEGLRREVESVRNHGMVLRDADGRHRAALMIDRAGHPVLRFFDAAGLNRLEVGLHSGNPRVALRGADGGPEIVALAREATAELRLRGPRDAVRVELLADEHCASVRADRDGRGAASLWSRPETIAFVVHDREGDAAAGAYIDDKSKPRWFTDPPPARTAPSSSNSTPGYL